MIFKLIPLEKAEKDSLKIKTVLEQTMKIKL